MPRMGESMRRRLSCRVNVAAMHKRRLTFGDRVRTQLGKCTDLRRSPGLLQVNTSVNMCSDEGVPLHLAITLLVASETLWSVGGCQKSARYAPNR